ncbi:MAG: serine/threonine protein kinase [Candidatus Obscuribacterales bacterium]|nr:serine/threonine protein kinase [Candidatus Obscuribacterales bacterium]
MSRLLRPGEIFNERYELLETLGSGGLGTVFKALQLDCGRIIALKILHADLASDADLRRRFLLEARALNSLKHANIVTVYHIGISGEGLPYLAMEFIKGKSLDRFISNGPLPVFKAIEICGYLADAMSLAHANGIVHRDLKPANVLISDLEEASSVKLIDFGLARLVGEQKSTSTGLLLGSAHYMSPEQCQGKNVDFRSDIYALTICLFEMMTGRKPFDADNSIALIYKQMHEALPRLNASELQPFDEAINDFIACGMAKSAENRFPDMSAFSKSLRALQEQLRAADSKKQPAVLTFGKLKKKTKKKRIYVSAFVALLLLGAISSGLKPQKKSAGNLEKQSKYSPEMEESIFPLIGKIRQLKGTYLDDAAALQKLLGKKISEPGISEPAICLLLVHKADLEADRNKKLLLAKEAYLRAEKLYFGDISLELNKRIYLSAAGFYINCLGLEKRAKEISQLSWNLRKIAGDEHLSSDSPFYISESPESRNDFSLAYIQSEMFQGNYQPIEKYSDDIYREFLSSKARLSYLSLYKVAPLFMHLKNHEHFAKLIRHTVDFSKRAKSSIFYGIRDLTALLDLCLKSGNFVDGDICLAGLKELKTLPHFGYDLDKQALGSMNSYEAARARYMQNSANSKSDSGSQ